MDQGIAEIGVDLASRPGHDHRVTTVLVAAMLAVLGHQGWRALRPGPARRGCPPGVSAWHALMALAMVTMLVASLPDTLAAAGAFVFAVGALWAALGAVRAPSDGSGARGVHGRLGVACVAMVAMLWPAAAAATPAGAAAVPAAPGPAADVAMAAMAHAHGSLGASRPGLAVTAVVVEAVLVVAVLAARRAVQPVGPAPRGQRRADACCETLMALTAVAMLAGPVLAAVAA